MELHLGVRRSRAEATRRVYIGTCMCMLNMCCRCGSSSAIGLKWYFFNLKGIQYWARPGKDNLHCSKVSGKVRCFHSPARGTYASGAGTQHVQSTETAALLKGHAKPAAQAVPETQCAKPQPQESNTAAACSFKVLL